MADKIDMFKSFKKEYVQPQQPLLVDASDAVYLAINGRGEPGGAAFQEALAALYAMAYTIKMTRKADGLQDYVIGKLEAEWWSDDGAPLEETDRSAWNQRLSIRTPDFIDGAALTRAATALVDKGKTTQVRAVYRHEVAAHRRGQLLHLGPYDEESENWRRLEALLKAEGLVSAGYPREIYLNDPRRTAPEKLKTLLCLPAAPA